MIGGLCLFPFQWKERISNLSTKHFQVLFPIFPFWATSTSWLPRDPRVIATADSLLLHCNCFWMPGYSPNAPQISISIIGQMVGITLQSSDRVNLSICCRRSEILNGIFTVHLTHLSLESSENFQSVSTLSLDQWLSWSWPSHFAHVAN